MCMPRPEVPECFRAFQLLQVRDSEATKNVKATFHVLKRVEQWVQTVAQRVRLQKLGTSRGTEEQPFCSTADEILQHFLPASGRDPLLMPVENAFIPKLPLTTLAWSSRRNVRQTISAAGPSQFQIAASRSCAR
jgi:hypothetical protein